jgi:membrane protein
MGVIVTWCLDFFVSFVSITFLFGLLYKTLPDIKLEWSEILFGSMIAAFLFILGKFILGYYLGTKHVANAFGPAGSLVVILIWLYYSAQILFLGAELITIKKLRETQKGNLSNEQGTIK